MRLLSLTELSMSGFNIHASPPCSEHQECQGKGGMLCPCAHHPYSKAPGTDKTAQGHIIIFPTRNHFTQFSLGGKKS